MERTTTRLTWGLVWLALLLTCFDTTEETDPSSITTTQTPPQAMDKITLRPTTSLTTAKVTISAPDNDIKNITAAVLLDPVAQVTTTSPATNQPPTTSAGQNNSSDGGSSDDGSNSASGSSTDDSSNSGSSSSDGSSVVATATVAATTINMLTSIKATTHISTETSKPPEDVTSKGLPTTMTPSVESIAPVNNVTAATITGSQDGAGGVTDNGPVITVKMTTVLTPVVLSDTVSSDGASSRPSVTTSTDANAKTVAVQMDTQSPTQSPTTSMSPTTINHITTATVTVNPASTTTVTTVTSAAQTTDTKTKTFSFSLNDGREKDSEKELAAVCRRLLENMHNGSCTLAWWELNGEKVFDRVKITGSVKDSVANEYYKEITKKPTDNTTLIAILASCGVLLIMIIVPAIYVSHNRKPFNETQQHLTEELHTVENGYHDNPTLEVMEVQPEMQEKKMVLNGEFSNDSWIVPIDNLLKEDIPDEEDTHL